MFEAHTARADGSLWVDASLGLTYLASMERLGARLAGLLLTGGCNLGPWTRAADSRRCWAS
jgi:hypothetical protein